MSGQITQTTYATDGKCHNSELGWLGQECGKRAVWIGTSPSKNWPGGTFSSGFCEACKQEGREAQNVTHWERAP